MTQVFEINDEDSKIERLYLVDAGEFLDDNDASRSRKHVYYAGKVFSDAAVSLRLVMPAMAMPLNKPKAVWLDDAYHGQAVFTMAGEWNAIMIIQRPGHDVIDLIFKLGRVQMK